MTQKDTNNYSTINESFAKEFSMKIHDITEQYSVLLDEFWKIAKKYNYPKKIIDDVLVAPITLGEIVDAYHRGCSPDCSWVVTALMYSE